MRKLIRNILLVVLLISFLVFPAYSESDKVEYPVILIPAGIANGSISYFQLCLIIANIDVDWIADANLRYGQYLVGPEVKNVNWEEVKSGDYKTAIFLFGTLSFEPSVIWPDTMDTNQVIDELKTQAIYFKQKGIKVIGIQFYREVPYLLYTDVDYTNKVIQELVPLMDEIIVFWIMIILKILALI